jgi:hypothetical protein
MICCSTKRKKKQVQAVVPIVIGPDGTPVILPKVLEDEFEPTCCEKIVKCCTSKKTVKTLNEISNNLLT